MLRTESVLRTLGEAWREKSPFEIGAEIFRRILEHPEGVEIARVDPERNLEDNIGFDDERIRLAPEPMVAEIVRAAATAPARGRGVSLRARGRPAHALDGEHDPARSLAGGRAADPTAR